MNAPAPCRNSADTPGRGRSRPRRYGPGPLVRLEIYRRILLFSLRAFVTSKARTLSVILAVALGIAALTIIEAALDAASVKADALVSEFGPDSIFIAGGNSVEVPLGKRPKTLTMRDIAAIRRTVAEVRRVEPFLLLENLPARAGDRRHEVASIVGASDTYQDVWNWKLQAGRDFTRQDIDRNAKICLIGTIAAGRLFGDRSPVGRILELNGIPLVVVGVLSARDVVASGAEQDDRIVLPYTTMVGRFNLNPAHVDGIRVKYASTQGMTEKSAMLKNFMRHTHNLPEGAADDFMVVSPLDILRFVSFLKGGFLLFLGLTAAVCLLVSGFILANLFYLSIEERTVEIGLQKALGARTRHIFMQFIFEITQLTTCGALAGLLLGALIGIALNQLNLLELQLSPRLFVTAVLAATSVALVFGLRPALAAARLEPAAALKGGEA